MNQDFRPVLVNPAVPCDGKIRVLHYKKQIDIAIEKSEDAWNILQYCNGRNDMRTISELSAMPITVIQEFIDALRELEVVVDSREQYLHFHRISNYPTPFTYSLTADEIREYTCSPRKPVMAGEILDFKKDKDSLLFPIGARRRSCRNYSDKKLSIDQIGNICYYAYSIHQHAVPSGGALYPLKIYVLICRDQEKINRGYYEYDAEQDKLILFNQNVDIEQLKYCFNQENLFFGASVQIIIAADFNRQAYKYANRGYRLSLIEAGHAAENINLYCSEQGMGTCEMGGIQDEPLILELNLAGKGIYPVVGVSVGYPFHLIDGPKDGEYFVIEKICGEKRPVKRYWVESFGVKGAFFGATAVYEDGNLNIQYAGATGRSYEGAAFKAVMEGYERWCSSQVRTDYYGPARNLTNWIHPKSIIPLTKDQIRKWGVEEFDEDLSISWTLGKLWDGSKIYIPSDIVYYGHRTQATPIYFSNSSGVAVFTDSREAEKRALVELIERDALMRNWYSRESPNIISADILPVHVANRLLYWKKHKRTVYILEIPSEYGWVFVSAIIGDKYPFFVSGAAAAIDAVSIESTIQKALQEAEYNLLLCLEYPDDADTIEPQNVLTPSEHGKIYHLKKYAETLSWLWNGKTVRTFAEHPQTNAAELIRKLDAVTVNLSRPNIDLAVIRILSPKLVPINFGFHCAHYTHPEVKKLHPESLKMPHYFA